MTDSAPVPKPLVFDDSPASTATSAKGPKVLSFEDDEASAGGALAPVAAHAPKPLSFDSLPDPSPRVAAAVAKPLFESEDHPAVRAAIRSAARQFPEAYQADGPRIGNQIRKLLPLTLANVSVWADEDLVEEARLVRDSSLLVQRLSQLKVPDLLESVLASGRPPTGMLDKLLNRTGSPESFRPALVEARKQLGEVATQSEAAAGKMGEVRQKLGIHLVSLAAVADAAGEAPDRVLAETLMHRRTLIQQALRQADLAFVQLEEVRRQGVDLMNQISTTLTVTLPALEMVKAQAR